MGYISVWLERGSQLTAGVLLDYTLLAGTVGACYTLEAKTLVWCIAAVLVFCVSAVHGGRHYGCFGEQLTDLDLYG